MTTGLVGTKELYDLLAQFDKDAKKLFYGHKIERADRSEHARGQYYNDGFVNQMFMAYMYGYQYSKAVNRE